MFVRAKYSIKIGKISIAKDTPGKVIALSNSESIKNSFPNLLEKDDSTYYIVKFADTEECLVDKSQLDFTPEPVKYEKRDVRIN